ncbi:MAG: caspase family protein [Gemmatimonadales bacterium]
MRFADYVRVSLCIATGLAGSHSVATAQTRRALLIGIDKYHYPQPVMNAWRARVVVQGAVVPRDPNALRGDMPDLDGAVNDARAMEITLRKRYGFTNTRVIENDSAARAGILAAIRQLIDSSRSGDIVVFYYAGHGSEQYNSLAPARVSLDHLDQTITPADADAGQFDIRNAELTALFDELLAKGVELTLIFDSCHSGSAVRGVPLPTKVRFAPIDPRDARDPSDPEPVTSSKQPHPALVLAGAQEFQPAEEEVPSATPDRLAHGAFTSALLQVMSSPTTSVNEPAEQVFKRAVAIVRWNGHSQVPVLKGTDSDHRRPLFGTGGDASAGRLMVAVVQVDGDTATLDAGLGVGIGAGSELRSADSGAPPVRLRITDVDGLGTSRAVATQGTLGSLKPGVLFVVDLWRAADDASMRAWIPRSLDAGDLARAAVSLRTLRTATAVEWTDDPTSLPDDGRPLYVVRYDGQGWAVFTPRGERIAIGAPDAAQVLSVIASREAQAARSVAAEAAKLPGRAASASVPEGKPRVFVLIPPTPGLRDAIHLGEGSPNPGVPLSTSPDSADYLLFGRLVGDSTQYAWIRPNATERSQLTSPFPARTDWIGAADSVAAGSQLEELALKLARVHGWLTLRAPAGSSPFPYRIGMQNAQNGTIKQEGDTTPTRGGENYNLVLVKDSAVTLSALPDSSWVYVFVVESQGQGILLYGQSGNKFPIDSAGVRIAPPVIVLPRRNPVSITAPYGVDTFIMITSATPLDPTVFNFDPVRTRGETRGTSQTGLSALLARVGGATRGVGDDPVPTDWSIQRIPLLSVPPAP